LRCSDCYNSNGREFEIGIVAVDRHRLAQPYLSIHSEFYLTEQAKKMLLSITKPVAVVTIAGVYRSGKSYLVNRLIRNKHNGFATGSSIEPVTKGLSIWSKPIPAKDEDGN
jgi:hypothetical protein